MGIAYLGPRGVGARCFYPANPRVRQGLTGITAHGFKVGRRRDHTPRGQHIGLVFWTDGWATQHSIPVAYDGKLYFYTLDESGSGRVKLIDISDETQPTIAAEAKPEIQLPRYQDSNTGSAMDGLAIAYKLHYCAADRQENPTALTCGWISSFIRVFGIRDPDAICWIAYYNHPSARVATSTCGTPRTRSPRSRASRS